MLETTSIDLMDLLENPFYLAEMLTCAANNYSERNMQIFESYLIITIMLNSDVRDIFLRTNKNGRIHSLFKEKEYMLYSFKNEVEYHKKNIDEAIMIFLSKTEVYMKDENSEISIENNYKCYLSKEYEKALKNIGKIFSKYRVEDLFNFLGVDKL